MRQFQPAPLFRFITFIMRWLTMTLLFLGRGPRKAGTTIGSRFLIAFYVRFKKGLLAFAVLDLTPFEIF